MTDMATLVAKVKSRWIASGLTPRNGALDAEARMLQERYQVRLPDDLAQYFRTVDGMNDGEADEHLIRFWRLAEVRPVVEELPEVNRAAYESYFVFADYSVWAHGYAVRLSSKVSIVAVVGGESPIQIASSFELFLQQYLQDPATLFPQRQAE